MHSFEGWIPARVFWKQEELLVDWCWLGELRLTDPFFEQTINQALSHPANLLFRRQTPVEALEPLAVQRPGLTPRGFVFHMSRCGSTLVSQMLAADPRHLVVSEASPIDAILRAALRNASITESQRVKWLRGMVSALGQSRNPGQRHLFIKFDCWHTLFLPLIRQAFPAVPWIFIYRQPLEVLVSQHHQRGAQMIPGVLEPGLFGWDSSFIREMRLDEYGGRVLAKISGAALQGISSGNRKLVNYCQLPELVWTDLMKSWGLECLPEHAERMAAVARQNAKNPVLAFETDSARKNQQATPGLREIARNYLEEIYLKLEAQRLVSGFA
jgi:hypothetical protein